MTLQLATRITADVSNFRQGTSDATSGLTSFVRAVDATNVRVGSLTALVDKATASAVAMSAGNTRAVSATAAAMGAMSAAANSNSLRPDQWKNLSFQINDVVTSLGSGAPAMQVLAQQGGQVLQVLQDAPGGVGGALRIIGARALGLATPFALATGGAVAFGAAALYAGTRWTAIQEQIERGLLGIGRASGATASGIERIASATAAASGNRLTTGDARDAAIAAASTGKIGAGNIGGVVGLVPGFAQLTGSSSSDAAGELARIFSDPAKGAEELNAKLGSLDYATLHYVQTLAAQGDRQGAISALVKAVQPDLERAAELTSAWARAWNAVKGAAGGAADTIGRTLSGGTAEDQLATVRRQIETLRKGRSGNANPADRDEVDYYKRQGLTDEQIKGLVSPAQPGSASRPGEDAKNLDNLIAKEKQLQAEIEKRAKDAADASARQTSIATQGTIRSLLPDIGNLEGFENKLAELRKTLADPAAVAMLGPLGKELPRAVDVARGAVETFIGTEERQRRSEDLTVRSILARTDAERGAIAAERERLSLAGQAISEDDRRQRIEAARTAVLSQSKRDSEDRLRSANDNAASAGLLPYQRQIADLEAKYREIFKGSTGNPAALANDRAAKAAERQAIDAGAIDAPIRDVLTRVGEQSRALQVQRDSLFASSEAAATMAAKQDLISDALRRGIDPVEAYRGRLDELAAALGRGSAANDEFQKAKAKIVGGMDELRSGSRGLLTGIFSDTRQGKSPLDGIMNSLGGMADKIFERTVSAPLAESLLGPDGKAGGGFVGDLVSGIFGSAGKSSVGTANITAATAIITGSISGGGDLLKQLANGTGTGSGATGFGLGGPAIGGSATVGDMGSYARAIKAIESGGGVLGRDNYSVVNSTTGALGAYQVMPANVPGWTKQALGYSMSPDDFLKDKASQDAVFQKIFGDYVTKFGPTGASQAWLGGPGSVGKLSRADANGTTVGGYGSTFDRLVQRDQATATNASGGITDWSKAADSFKASTEEAAQSVSGLTTDMSALPVSLTQVSQGLGQLGSALGSSGVPGGGLVGILGKLLGLAGSGSGGGSSSGGGSGFTDLGNGAVAVAGGGHVRGPGTSTSDSIAARLSDGEFVVNAAATSRHLDLLHAMNENRLPAFAEGGRVTPLPGMRGSRAGGSGVASPGAGDPAGQPVVNIYNQESGRVEATASRGPGGSTDIMIRAVEGRLSQRANNGQGPFSATVGGAAFRTG